MYRNVINDFASWYDEPKRKLLYVKGALGVGKTWSVRDFATGFFESFLYIDLTKRDDIKSLLTLSSIDKDIIERINSNSFPLDDKELESIIKNIVHKLDEKLASLEFEGDLATSLLIFDNAENMPFSDIVFHEFARLHPHQAVCIVASTMEITPYEYHYKDVFKLVRMRPMSFEEYLIANKSQPLIAAIENNKTTPLKPFEEESILKFLKEYMLIGGMPKIVHDFKKNHDYNMARTSQLQIIKAYEQIIYTKLSSAMSQRCRRVWKSIPSQLERDNKKFMYKYVEENARAREYSEATLMLCNLGFARKLPRLVQGILPLEENADYKSFELFMTDHGLLRAMYGLPMDDSLSLLDIFTEKNGAVGEQFAFQELSAKLGYLYYWVSGATARVPFIYEGDKAPVPVDLRFIPKNKAQNVKTFIQKNKSTDVSLKISLDQVSLNNSVLNVPAYSLWTII